MKLTAGELRVMQILWEHGEMKPSEIQERFSEDIKNSAIRSFLSVLLEKGHVKRRLVGKAYYYKAVTKERRAFHTMLMELVETFCGGSKEALVMTLLENEELTPQQLIELGQHAEGGKACDTKARTIKTGNVESTSTRRKKERDHE